MGRFACENALFRKNLPPESVNGEGFGVGQIHPAAQR